MYDLYNEMYVISRGTLYCEKGNVKQCLLFVKYMYIYI